MGKSRACDVCSLRKIRCNGTQPCLPCVKASFDCSFAKKPLKPGPKGPRATTSNRIRKKLHDIRSQTGVVPRNKTAHAATSSTANGTSQSPDLGNKWPYTSSPPTLAFSAGLSNITFNDVSTYLDIFHRTMYPVWPVIEKDALLTSLGPAMGNAEACALAFSVCAATGAQLRLNDGDSPSNVLRHTIVDLFAQEAERCRMMTGAHKNARVVCILIPFFLSMYYSSRKKRFTATLLLREALTLCELLDLDKEAVYATLDPAEQKYRRKIFWLLFITERGTAMQYDMATILRNTISVPSVEDDHDPVTFAGFLSLVHLFVAVEGTLIGAGTGEHGHAYTSEVFAQLQQKLRDEPPMPPNSNEVQRTDIAVTQQWMRMLVWQLCMKKISMTAGSAEDPLSLTYPAHIARDSLAFLSRVSLDSIIAHGPGMEIKIFEIANTLLDVINCVPSLTTSASSLMKQGPRDIFHGLSCLLASLSGGQSRSLALLQGKIAEAEVPFMPIPRLVEVPDEITTSPSSNGPRSAPHANGSEVLFASTDWRVPQPTVPLVPKRSDLDETVDIQWSHQRMPHMLPDVCDRTASNGPTPHFGLANGLALNWTP